MADNVKKGVINHKCQVFDPDGDVYDGLYVCDGAAMPRGLGSNPHLTITAVAEFAMDQLIKEKEWSLDLSRGEPSFSVPQPPGPDYVAELEKALSGLKAIRSAIDGKAYELAQQLLKGLARQLADFTPEQLWKVLENIENMEPTTGPILDILIDAIEPMLEALKAKKYMDVLSIAESKLGDFSPRVHFHERMVGRVSDVGLSDPDPIFDAYESAEAAVKEDNLSFEATIKCPSVLKALTPQNFMSFDEDAVLVWNDEEYQIEGTFGLFFPEESEIEQWRMYYDGTFKKDRKKIAFEGFKILQHREGSHWWRDLNELSVDIKDGDTVLARGKLHVGLESVLEQASGLTIEYASDLSDAAQEVYMILATATADTLLAEFKKKDFLAKVVKAVVQALESKTEIDAQTALEQVYRTKVFARFGELILRTYGGVFSYMSNFPALESTYNAPTFAEPDLYFPEVEPGVFTKLTRYCDTDADKGPVILAGGFGTKASSLATTTIDKSIVQMLFDEGYDVWLYDYRGSGDIQSSLQPFTIDDVATKDWPAALDLITAVTGVESVQALVHCVGSMSLFMAVLAGETRVRSIISSQLGPHAIGNWLKYVQADSPIADWLAHGFPEGIVKILEYQKVDEEILKLARDGMTFVEPRSPSEPKQAALDPIIDGLLWQTPSFQPVPCNSPTCHRINFFFGPSYRHEQLNQATHNAIREMFGAVSSAPFLHLSNIFKEGRAHSWDGSIDYFKHPERLSMPVHFIAGAKNQEMLPEATLRTQTWLKTSNGKKAGPYTRKVFQNYGHMDCFIGKTASKDIFPHLVEVLGQHAEMTKPLRKKRKG
jgi:pimeloyl-ACP methyl ester carboxylesterase